MYQLVRKTLEVYLQEKRIITLSDISQELIVYSTKKDAVFVTLYYQGKVIASSGRISCKKENSLFECIDNSLLCLKDPRFLSEIQTVEMLSQVRIRVDIFSPQNRRVLQTIDDLDTTREGVIFLSQNMWVLSVILPHMVHVNSSANAYFELACKKANVDPHTLQKSDYVLYGLSTESSSDF